MQNRRRLCSLLGVLTILGAPLPPVASAASVVGPSWATKLVLYNASNQDTAVLITFPKGQSGNAPIQDGCPQSPLSVKYVDLTANSAPAPLTPFLNGAEGWFLLKRGHQAQVISQGVDPYSKAATYCFQGLNIGFGGLPASNCPQQPTLRPNTTPGPAFNQQIPYTPAGGTGPLNGTNGAEVTLNMPALNPNANGPQYVTSPAESVDLTCEAGAVWRLGMQVTPPVGGPYWQYNAGSQGGGSLMFRSTFTTQNSWVKIKYSTFDPQTGTFQVDSAHSCDDNCIDPRTGLPRPGVFPYGCSACNIIPDPNPQCASSKPNAATTGNLGQFCAVKNGLPSNNGCQLNRSPANNYGITPPTPTGNPANALYSLQKFGGTVRIIFFGPISPPAQCP